MGTEKLVKELPIYVDEGFHSINVPSEWGLGVCRGSAVGVCRGSVSIQLMSPASGDKTVRSCHSNS